MAQLGSGAGSSFPVSIDTTQNWANATPVAPDGTTRLDAEMANDFGGTLVTIETVLGAGVQGAFPSVAARLDALTGGVVGTAYSDALFASLGTLATLSGQAFTAISTGLYRLETEGGAGSDTLNNIGGLPDGHTVKLMLATAGRTITINHQGGGTGNLRLANGAAFALNSLGDSLWLQRRGSVLYEFLRANVPA